MLTLILILLSVLVAAAGLWWTIQIGRKQKTYTEDKVNPAVTRHTALLNPVFIAIFAFTVIITIMIYIAYFVY
ncbi:hypothetical protein KUV80_07240 [Fictibacillus nanhaiensis]|uniref:hypothetical protein n=1 Tax=Fictibacillus nanhaiensis TaxID=742169 RepID=UPI001C982B7F|nr:hypothetical protein [Fictibacillus nanhaiensis]MBY6036440.1 hypothetical protein [Fictibacillus nanhaiensis]